MNRSARKGSGVARAARLITAGALAALTLTACAPVQHFHPQPIAPAATATRLEHRNLADPGLKQFMERNFGRAFGTWPLESWNLNELALAAYYFNPQMEIARAQTQAAEAAITTAGARPNPTLSMTPGIPGPYLLGLDLLLPVTRAERRKIRIERAEALSTAAGYALAATAWKVRSAVRSAALNEIVSERRALIVEQEAALRSQRVQWLRARLAAGETAKPDVESARLQLLNTRLALRAAQGQIDEARTALAGALGVPAGALAGIKLSPADFDHTPGIAALSPEMIQRDAVLNRLDVRQSLAQYEASQAALQLEIARQYPNLLLGPGYHYEETNNFFTLSVSTTLPVFNRNQGPIAEAEARRREAAASFLATQASALAQAEQALARYRTALAELEEARRAVAQTKNVQEPMARQAVSSGESDRLFLNSVQLEGTAVAAAELTALYNVQIALGQLEETVQRPLEPGELPPPAVRPEAQRKEIP